MESESHTHRDAHRLRRAGRHEWCGTVESFAAPNSCIFTICKNDNIDGSEGQDGWEESER